MGTSVMVPERVAWIVRDARGQLAAGGTRQRGHQGGIVSHALEEYYREKLGPHLGG